MKSKIIVPIVLLVILTAIFAGQSVFAQSVQVTSNVSLTHLNVLLTYPSIVLPGQLVTVNLTANAKDSFQLTSLSMQVYLADQNNLRQLTSTTLAQNVMMSSGDQLNKQVQAKVPSNATRTSLVALVTESGYGMNSYSNGYRYPYYGYPYYSNYYNNYYNGYYNYPYNNYNNYYNYPSYSSYNYPYSYQSISDNALASLSYVQATTSEYVTLQSQYQQLQAQNQQLQQQLQASQNSTAQKDNTISNLSNQLSSAQGTTTLVEAVAVILAIAAFALAALHFKPTTTRTTTTRTTDTESHPAVKTEEKTTDV
jgi:hypothetical protein